MMKNYNLGSDEKSVNTHLKLALKSCLEKGLLLLLGWWRSTVVERRSLANFPCPALDLQLMGGH